MNGIERAINRLEEAIETQKNTEGEIASIPTVAYCFECDEIMVDELAPKRCLDHATIHSDGYEHGGIHDTLTALRYLHAETDPQDPTR